MIGSSDPLTKHTRDLRPESYRPTGEIERIEHLGTKENWRDRRELLLRRTRIYRSLNEIIQAAKSYDMSLAVFKPASVIDFTWEATDREWDPNKLAAVRAMAKQPSLFDDRSWRRTFRVVDKIPYKFYYHIKDDEARQSRMRILEWQLGALYRNCIRLTGGDEERALVKVKQKYFGEFVKADLHLFLGTTLAWHKRAPNPWTIVGVLPIPHERQRPLFAMSEPVQPHRSS